jgi:hypothetical protein
MGMTSARASRDPGWFFLIQGIMWLVGFLGTQFAPSIAAPLWIALNASGTAAMVAVGLSIVRKAGRAKHPGLASRIVAIAIGILAFDVMLALSLGLSDPRDFSLLIVLSMGFCYFVIGLTTRQAMSAMGAFIALSAFGARMLFPAYYHLAVAIFGGGAFIAWGLAVLLRKAESDD